MKAGGEALRLATDGQWVLYANSCPNTQEEQKLPSISPVVPRGKLV